MVLKIKAPNCCSQTQGQPKSIADSRCSLAVTSLVLSASSRSYTPGFDVMSPPKPINQELGKDGHCLVIVGRGRAILGEEAAASSRLQRKKRYCILTASAPSSAEDGFISPLLSPSYKGPCCRMWQNHFPSVLFNPVQQECCVWLGSEQQTEPRE